MEFPTHEQLRPRLSEISEFARTHPDSNHRFVQKMENLADPRRGGTFLRHFYYELGLAGIDRGSRVIMDAGCGTGRHSMLFALIGVERVHAFDMNGLNTASLSTLLRNVPLPITLQLRDVADTGLPDNSIDFVFRNEAISHFQDHRGLLREAGRLLR